MITLSKLVYQSKMKILNFRNNFKQKNLQFEGFFIY